MINIFRRRTARAATLSAMLILVSTTLLSVTALAGEKSSSIVTVDTAARTASGDLSTARSGSIYDTRSKIGCTVNSENSVSCFAVNSSGLAATCSKYQAAQSMVNAVMHLASDGYVFFQWDATGACSYVLTEKASRWAPKR
jgi:hypothetical protein